MSHEPEYLEHEHPEPDEWHTHTAEEEPPQEEHAAHVNYGVLTAWFVGLVVALVATIGLIVLFFNHVVLDERREKVETTVLAEEFKAYQAESQRLFEGYSWVDHNTVRIPHDAAVQKVMAEYAGAE